MNLNIVSRVSDKNPNDKGHPIQYDTTKNQWFVHTINEHWQIVFIMVHQYIQVQMI